MLFLITKTQKTHKKKELERGNKKMNKKYENEKKNNKTQRMRRIDKSSVK